MMQIKAVSPEHPPAHEPAHRGFLTAFDSQAPTAARPGGTKARSIEWVLALTGVLVLADAFDATVYALFDARTRVAHVPLSRSLLLVPLVAAGMLLAGHRREAVAAVRAAWVVWPAVILAAISAVWSDQPGTTVAWAIALIGTSVFGVALAVCFTMRELAVLTAVAVTAIGLASGLLVMVAPGFSLDGKGRWHALYVHRNLLGRIMALGVAAATVIVVGQRWATVSASAKAVFAFVVCGGVLLATTSRAAILSALSSVMTLLLLRVARRWRRRAIAIVGGGVAAGLLVMLLLVMTPTGLAFMQRSPTLTDRTTLWRAVGAAAMQAPWLGHGYGGFWSGPGGQQARTTWLRKYPVGHAHNGALDLFAELGLVGVVMVALPLAFFSITALRHGLRPGATGCFWPATYLAFFIVSNAAESALLRHKIYWALYVAIACHLSRRPGRSRS